MDVHKITSAYFIGVGGIGVSAILRLFHSRGIKIAGSDVALPPLSSLPSGVYHEGADAVHVPDDADVLIYSAAVPASHPERVAGKEKGIPELSYPEALALVTKPYTTIAVSGTHGKSTTTALLGKLFEAEGLDPSVIVGAEVPGWKDRNLREGGSDLFVVEACEYRRHMLNLSPQAILLTNIELDHPDYYVDLADVKNAFREYIAKLSGEDLLIVNNDDANIRDIITDFDGIIVRYGIGEGPDLFARNVRELEDRQTFELVWKGSSLGTFTTPLPGLYNIYNILAASAAYFTYGGQRESAQKTIEHFSGVGRRFETVGDLAGTTVISDYAHHPTALRSVVSAAKGRFAGKRLLTVFRPHHRERTQKLFDEFVEVIANIPHTILVEIYDVAGREDALTISSKDVITKTLELHPAADVVYAENLAEAEKLVREKHEDFDVILIVGAGDADKLAHDLVKHDRIAVSRDPELEAIETAV